MGNEKGVSGLVSMVIDGSWRSKWKKKKSLERSDLCYNYVTVESYADNGNSV